MKNTYTLKGQCRHCTTYTASFKDFNGDAEKWRLAYFELLSWKNTYSRLLRMDICADSQHDPFLILVMEEGKANGIYDLLESLGYSNIEFYSSTSIMVDPYPITNYTDEYVEIDDIFIEW